MSKIEWTDKTWSPIVGCTKISEGCKNCFAERMAFRLTHILGKTGKDISSSWVAYSSVITDGKWNGQTELNREALTKPSSWKKPRKIFVCDMGDLFHESVSFELILQIWDIMCQTPRHTYQILTKRPYRILKFLKWLGEKCKNDGLDSVPSSSDNLLDYIDIPDHIWIGVTAENQQTADERIPILLDIPAKVRFVSCEPLLSNICMSNEFSDYLEGYNTRMSGAGGGMPIEEKYYTNKIDWVIAGPETGPKARPMQKEWIENIYKQCKSANVPFFDKKDILGLNLKEFPI